MAILDIPIYLYVSGKVKMMMKNVSLLDNFALDTHLLLSFIFHFQLKFRQRLLASSTMNDCT
jgi:hypothetical protein